MIYFLLGDDRESKINKTVLLKKDFETKHKDTIFYYFDNDNFDFETFEKIVNTPSLFGEKVFVVLENCLDEIEKEVDIKTMVNNNDLNIIFQEKVIGREFLDLGLNVETFSKNTEMDFSLWGAVSRREKKEAWISLLSKIEKEEVEQVLFSLLSQFKNIYKAKNVSSATFKDLGFTKESSFMAAKKSASLYTELELTSVLKELTFLSLNQYSGAEDVKLSLEAIVLKYI
jgi:DNA polymerase III delta subunit